METAYTKFCQSCGMPMDDCPELYGINADGSVSSDYCKYCYQDGKFTADETMEQMIECCVPFMVEKGMPEEEARRIMTESLPMLKRWKKA